VRSVRRFGGISAFIILLALASPSEAVLTSGVHSLALKPADQPLSLVEPGAMTAGPDGGLYVYDSSRHQVLLREPDGMMRVVAGNGIVGESGDGSLATSAELGQVVALALAPDGTLYISGGNRVRAVSPSGVIARVAGNGRSAMPLANGSEQCPQKITDGTIATHAAIGSPGIAVSPSGHLYLTGLPCSNDVAVLRGRRLYLVLVPASFLGADPLFPQDRQPGPIAIAFDRSGDLYLGGDDPYAVFALRPGGRLHTIGFLRQEPPDALAAGPPGSVVDAGNLSLVRFSATARWSGGSRPKGHLLFDYSLRGLLSGRQYFADGGVAVFPNGTAVVDGNAWGAPGDCHHALLVEVTPKGQLKLIGNWQPHRSGPSC
jgi:hypothetical protein